MSASDVVPVIEVVDASFAYAGPPAVEVLQRISLSVRAGDLMTISGRSGSGKSTLLSLMGLLERPTAGAVRVGGVEITDSRAADRARRSTIGFVFQAFHLARDRSALDNVATPLAYQGVRAAERRTRSRAALERVGLGHRVDHYPSSLSGGEQQRVALARAIAVSPQVILADEPTGNLDAFNAQMVLDMLVDLAAADGRAVVIVTHDPIVANAGRRQIHMVDSEGGSGIEERSR